MKFGGRLITAVALGGLIAFTACGGGDGDKDESGDVGVDVPAETTADVPAEVPADLPVEAIEEAQSDVPADLPHPDDSGQDLADPGADPVTPDETPVDVPAEVAPDALEDAPEDVAADTPADTGCAPLTCDLYCPFGFRTGADGCEVCACRWCNQAEDCLLSMRCDSPVCGAEGVCRCECGEGEGAADYYCPDGTTVPWCACTGLGVRCVEHPEYQCPTLCHADQKVSLACPDGSTQPWCECKVPDCGVQCDRIGTEDEGWYDTCTDALLLKMPCVNCSAACKDIGSKSEGWVDNCTGSLITWAICAPTWNCQDAATVMAGCTGPATCPQDLSAPFTCPDGSQVPFCACTAGNGMDCNPTPWTACTTPLTCTGEGGSFNLTGGFGQCCPGFIDLNDLAYTPPDQCSPADCDCHVCTQCGDGLCTPPENWCNCLADCM